MALGGVGTNPKLNEDFEENDDQNEIEFGDSSLKRKRTSDSSESGPQPPKKTERIFETVFYDENNNGVKEFFVLIDLELKAARENERKRINEIKVFEILESLKLERGLIRIKRIGFRRAKVLYENATEANQLIKKMDDLKKFNLKPFIPIGFVVKYGIIRDIPKNISTEKLEKNIRSNIPVRPGSVFRFTRVDPYNESKKINTTTIKVGFQGNDLPESVTLFLSERKVEFFVPRPKQCHRCGRLGHITKTCKASRLCCLRCGRKNEDGTDGNCNPPCNNEPQICILCGKNDHNCFDRAIKCPKKLEQEDLNKIMVINNLAYSEVKDRYPNPSNAVKTSSNQFSLLAGRDYDLNFPEIPSRSPKTKNNYDETNRILRKHHTYNKITAQKCIEIPPPTKFATAEPIQEGSHSVFSVPFERVTEMEKTINMLLTGLIRSLEEVGDEKIKQSILKAKTMINNISLQCDELMINSGKNDD